MGASVVFVTAGLFHADSVLHLSSTGISLLSSRSMLFCQRARHAEHLGLSAVETTTDEHVLFGLREQCGGNCDVEEFDGVSFARQGDEVSAGFFN